jgi:hypothetical protein
MGVTASCSKDFTSQRNRRCGVVDEVERCKNRTTSTVRAKVEHPFGGVNFVNVCAIAG